MSLKSNPPFAWQQSLLQIGWILAILFVGMAPPVFGCLWDRETLAAEKAKFPGLLDVMTGNFPRHSKEFHEWRKAMCEKVLAKNPKQFALYDDLAVSQHKLGDHAGAVATMMKKEKLKPGLYETYSNLGTFCIYLRQLDESVSWLTKALAINPNAHFGREKYQKWLVEWARRNAATPDKLRFHAVILLKQDRDPNSWEQRDQDEALTGILGMMRFADYDNPLLLEALGDVLSAGHIRVSSSLMAGCAYSLARARSTEPAQRERIQASFDRVRGYLEKNPEEEIAEATTKKMADANTLAQEVRKDEMNWIAAGLDASAEFERKYLAPAK